MCPEDKNLLLYSTVLHSDDSQYLEILLDMGANPDYRHHRIPILPFAISQDRRSWVKSLLRGGSSTHLLPGGGAAALRNLVVRGNTKCAQVLVEHGASLNPEDTQSKTLLVTAICNRHKTIAQTLIQAGADVNARSAEKYSRTLDTLARTWTSTNCASHINFLQGLLQAGAGLSPEMHTHLMQRAVCSSNDEAVWILARDISWIGFEEVEYSLNTICILLRLGADLGVSMYWGEPILQRALRERHRGIVLWLLRVYHDIRRSQHLCGTHIMQGTF